MVVAITSLLDSSESRAKELNGLLETTLTKVSIDEAGDANICESKWVVLINGLEHYNIVILY